LQNALLTLHKEEYYHSDLISSRLYKGLEHEGKMVSNFSDREMEFLSHVCKDLTYAQIAELMNVSESAVEKCRDSLCNKLDVHGRIALAMCAIRMGIEPIS
jgi:DNA-binding NarL/FixJ family response regulator